MFNEITIQRLAAGTTFKLAAIGMLATFVPFSVLMGCFALFGANTLTWNNENIYGVTAVAVSPFIGLLIALLFTLLLGSAMAFGLWAYSKFRPLTLLVKAVENPLPEISQ